MQPKNIRRKSLQDDSELIKFNQEKKFASNTGTPQVEAIAKLIDKDYQRMIRNKKGDLEDYEPDPHVEVGNSKIFVVVRKRPLSKKEQLNGEIDNITCLNPKITVHECKIKIDGITKYLEDHHFYFDNTFAENESTQEIYDYTVGPMIEMVLNKGIVTCFAYGQTGSGKTYTMKGIENLAINHLFEECQNMYGEEHNLSFYISFFEIYGGRLYDLLNNKNKLQVLDDQNGKTQIYGLQEIYAGSPDEMRMIIDKGNSIRTTHNTVTNATSSRSHAICNIIIKEKNKKNKYNFFGKLSLVDLAGSERAQETQSNNRVRRAEGAEINKSLLALKECIRALQARKNSGNSEIHVPFRASKLTHVLRDSFVSKNDKSKIIMISCINPSYISSNHTINTLRYSDRLKEQTAYMQKQIAKNKNLNNNVNNIHHQQHNYQNNHNNNKKEYNIAKKIKRDREKELEEINLNVFNSKDDILNDINFDDKINLAEDILGFHNDLNLNIDMNNLADELINDNFINNKKPNMANHNKGNKKEYKNSMIQKIEKENEKNMNNNEEDEIVDLSKKEEEMNEKNKKNSSDEDLNVKDSSDLEEEIKEGDEKEINEELEDLIYLKKKVSKDGKFISDDFIKYHKLTDQIIEDEDDILATHMDVIKQDAKMLTEEGELITKIKGIEDNGENFTMEEYLKRLENIINKKINIYSGLQNKIETYKQHIKDEEKMRKEHPQFFVDPADL